MGYRIGYNGPEVDKLLQKAQKKQEYIKQLESTESGKVEIDRNDMIYRKKQLI